jgi:hypothetical protein
VIPYFLVNKKLVIVAIVLILIAVGAYAFIKKAPQANKDQKTVKTQDDTTKATDKEMLQGTLKSLLTAGKSQKCTYSANQDNASMNGTLYVADGKMRGDFVSGIEEEKVNGHMIVNGEYSYVWTDKSDKGMKMKFNLEDQAKAVAEANSQALNLNQEYNYDCQGWARDPSVFTPPANISFETFAIPSIAIPTGSEDESPACAACDSAPEGEIRDTCKTKLNCK